MENPTECDSVKKTGHGRITWIVGIFALLAGVVIFWIICYSLVTNKVVETGVQNMEELSQHDEQSIASSLDDQWKALEEIAAHLKTEQYATEEALAMGLNDCERLLDCTRLTLITDDGYALNSAFKVGYNKEFLDYCISADGPFIRWIENKDSGADGIGEVLVCGTEIEPLTVQGHTYTYIGCRMNVDAFEDLLKIDCYDGRGYSSVIDTEGNYIVSIRRDYSAQKIDNFFDGLADGSFPKEYSLDDIRRLVETRETFTLEYTGADGEKYVATFNPFPEIEWCFVTVVPKDVFREQGRSLTLIVTVIVSLMFTMLMVNVVILLIRRSKLYHLEVENRKRIADALAAEEAAGRAKTRFFNSMSHDIRTPMNAIVGFTALATAHIDDKERVADYLEKIGSASSHLLALINDILDMSRIESGKMSLEEKPENLPEIVRELSDIVQADVFSKELHFSVDTEGITHEAIFCDRLKLKQILLNLLSNAVKYTNPGGTISVRVAERALASEGCAAYEFCVKDNGIGMSSEFAKTVFEPFAREKTSAVNNIQGTGLGMAITKNLVDMMGGTIAVESEEGKGTTITVTVDFRLQSEQPEKDADQPVFKLPGENGAEQEPDLTAGGRRLLLVEDVELNRVLAVTILEMAGFEVDCAENGKEAVEKAAGSAPGYYQAILMDIQMPVMDGYEASRLIRGLSDPALASIPIIAMTADAFEEDKQMALDAGMNAHVSKPIDISNLLDTLQQVLDNKK